MGSIVGELKNIENGDSSLLIPTPKYKRRKVYAKRTFPPGCGPNAAPLCEQTQTEVAQGDKAINVDDVVNKVLQDIENGGEKGGDIREAERKEPQEQMIQPGVENGVELKASDSATCGTMKCVNEASKNLSAENTDTSVEIQNVEENPILRDDKHDPPNDLVEAKSESPTTRRDSGIIESKELTDASSDEVEDEGTIVEQCLLPHHPLPSNLVWKERKYPRPRRVSAVRTFPAGCGRNLTTRGDNRVVEDKSDTKMQETGVLNKKGGNPEKNKSSEDKIQDMVPEKSGYTHEQISEPNEEVAVEMVTQAPMLGQPCEIKGREENLEDNKVEHRDIEQSGYEGKDEMDIGSLPDRLKHDIVVYVKDKDKKKKPGSVSVNDIESKEESSFDNKIERPIIVQGIMSEASCPWRQGKGSATFGVRTKESNRKKRPRSKFEDSAEKVEEKCTTIVPYVNDIEVNEDAQPLQAISYDDDSSENEEHNDFQFLPRSRDCEVTPPPFMAGSSSDRSPRSKVRETLRLFQVLVRKILHGEETKEKEKGKAGKRVDILASSMMKAKGKYINTQKRVGAVPGVEIGDIFSYRLELAVIGLHTPLQSGIDIIKQGKSSVAISVVASGGYDNDVENSDVLIYTGQGGNPTGPNKQHEDQKLERANLALKNCIDEKSPVRVVRGFKETKSKSPDKGDGRSKMVATYTYDGLYTVEKYWTEVAPSHGKLVYKFELRRIPGQHQLAWKEVKQSKKGKKREGCCVDDISKGKEKSPICAINTIDDEKPPPFTYITSVMYPDWCRPIPPRGCSCKDGCLDTDCCSCAANNGGEIPYNLSGAIVEAKPLVYECGPSCKCPLSCPNRVSQHGIKLPLEIFKTGKRGWGVRSISAIPSGSFICEYIGELLDDKEAEERAGSDEYLFDIGQNYNDSSLSDGVSALMPETPSVASDVVENVGFTIDAARFGNIGRFINHSCSPNLYAQNVLYDYEDKRIPHIMMFAAENIPPLQELTYHYNYTIDQVFDLEGKIKKKECYCGASECNGRMY
ncbi:histone-lysine N-methyltransferase, H3 lysine-9 specific SUVH6-like [Silene latifolia]|uniref:histone-lysine N-methyltransferase, H3 lysine-9 specific SUVH6-like n=1 Tax=Silene latifolia TaxID=37657 RepID=UPI003D788D09